MKGGVLLNQGKTLKAVFSERIINKGGIIMLITTTENIPGKEYEILGLAKGSTIQSKHLGKDIGAGIRNLVGGEVKAYVEMMNEARDIATSRMEESALQMGADAIVCVRYGTSAVMASAAEVMAYGTAVKFK